MKVLISYPPLSKEKGCPTLGQNRQFQYFKEPTFIYPVVPAQAATLLKQDGHDVVWNDCLAQGMDQEAFFALIDKERPNLIAFETKTPVIKEHWKLIDLLKSRIIGVKCVLFGDHVTALPEESLKNSNVDFVLTGGDYDFLLLNLCNHLRSLHKVRVTDLAPLEAGIYYRDNGAICNTGKFRLDHKLDELPYIDRELTNWRLYAYNNGNYKRTPGTYIMSGRDCWFHQCTFCSWPTLYPEFRVRSVTNVLDEIDDLVERYNVREIMDDTGCFPVGDWLRDFCQKADRRSFLRRKVYLDANMRFGALSTDDFKSMKKVNFRLLLFGLESANQSTLDRLKKGVKVERIIEDCKSASRAGLFPHITIMFGYPWESYEDALRTFNLGAWLLKKGYAYTMQATLVVPYPGTGLFSECREAGLLKSLEWNDYDMKKPLMKSRVSDDLLLGLVQKMYRVPFDPEFIIRKMLMIRDYDDLKYFFRAGRKVVGHILDFKHKSKV